MITAATADPLVIGSGAYAGFRNRPTTGEQSLLPESPLPAPKNSGANENGTFPRQDAQAQPHPEPERNGAASMFAAAVIAGNLPPTPQTMEQLIQRIGISPISEESQARLKDLIA